LSIWIDDCRFGLTIADWRLATALAVSPTRANQPIGNLNPQSAIGNVNRQSPIQIRSRQIVNP
jgi:hypothetical protein